MYCVLAVISAMPVCLHFSGHFVMFSSFNVHEQALNCVQKEWFTKLFSTVTFSGIYLFLNEEIPWKLDVKFSLFA